MIEWDPTDLLECLEVEPAVDKSGVEHTYEVIKDGLKLIISVFQYDGEVYFSLMRENETEHTIIDLKINQCPEITFSKFGKCEQLDFHPGRQRIEKFDKSYSITKGVRVQIKPDIKIELYKL